MVGEAVLRKVIGADLFAAVARANHGAALGAYSGLLLFELELVEPRAQHAFGFGAVLDLRFFVLAGDYQAGGQVRDAYGRVSGIYRLSAGTRGTKRIDANVLRLDLDFHFVGFGQHSHGDSRSVYAALLFGDGHALHAVYAALVLELAEDAVAADQRDDFLEAAYGRFAAGGDFHLPSLRFGVARVHAEDFVGEERGFIAAGAGANLEHYVLLVVGIFGQQQDLELVVKRCQFRRQTGHFLFGHGLQLRVIFVQHAARLREAVFHALPLAVFADGLFQIGALFGDLAVLLAVGNHGVVGHQLIELFEALFELLKLR